MSILNSLNQLETHAITTEEKTSISSLSSLSDRITAVGKEDLHRETSNISIDSLNTRISKISIESAEEFSLEDDLPKERVRRHTWSHLKKTAGLSKEERNQYSSSIDSFEGFTSFTPILNIRENFIKFDDTVFPLEQMKLMSKSLFEKEGEERISCLRYSNTETIQNLFLYTLVQMTKAKNWSSESFHFHQFFIDILQYIKKTSTLFPVSENTVEEIEKLSQFLIGNKDPLCHYQREQTLSSSSSSNCSLYSEETSGALSFDSSLKNEFLSFPFQQPTVDNSIIQLSSLIYDIANDTLNKNEYLSLAANAADELSKALDYRVGTSPSLTLDLITLSRWHSDITTFIHRLVSSQNDPKYRMRVIEFLFAVAKVLIEKNNLLTADLILNCLSLPRSDTTDSSLGDIQKEREEISSTLLKQEENEIRNYSSSYINENEQTLFRIETYLQSAASCLAALIIATLQKLRAKKSLFLAPPVKRGYDSKLEQGKMPLGLFNLCKLPLVDPSIEELFQWDDMYFHPKHKTSFILDEKSFQARTIEKAIKSLDFFKKRTNRDFIEKYPVMKGWFIVCRLALIQSALQIETNLESPHQVDTFLLECVEASQKNFKHAKQKIRGLLDKEKMEDLSVGMAISQCIEETSLKLSSLDLKEQFITYCFHLIQKGNENELLIQIDEAIEKLMKSISEIDDEGSISHNDLRRELKLSCMLSLIHDKLCELNQREKQSSYFLNEAVLLYSLPIESSQTVYKAIFHLHKNSFTPSHLFSDYSLAAYLTTLKEKAKAIPGLNDKGEKIYWEAVSALFEKLKEYFHYKESLTKGEKELLKKIKKSGNIHSLLTREQVQYIDDLIHLFPEKPSINTK